MKGGRDYGRTWILRKDNRGCEQCEEAIEIDGPKAGACFECFEAANGIVDLEEFWASEDTKIQEEAAERSSDDLGHDPQWLATEWDPMDEAYRELDKFNEGKNDGK